MHARSKQHPTALWSARINKLYRANEAPPALGEEFREFFLPRKDVRNGEIVFTENAPQLLPG